MIEMNKLEDIELNFIYSDILYLDRPKSKYPKLSIEQRAAQFAPFSALTGYDEQIKETGRETMNKKILTEEEKNMINQKINYLNLHKNTIFKIIYFLKDNKKDGGSYFQKISTIKKIDSYNKILILENNLKIPFTNILNIELNCYQYIK